MTDAEWPKPGDVVAVRGRPNFERERPFFVAVRGTFDESGGLLSFLACHLLRRLIRQYVRVSPADVAPWRSAEEVRAADARVRELEAALREASEWLDGSALAMSGSDLEKRIDALLASPTPAAAIVGESSHDRR